MGRDHGELGTVPAAGEMASPPLPLSPAIQSLKRRNAGPGDPIHGLPSRAMKGAASRPHPPLVLFYMGISTKELARYRG